MGQNRLVASARRVSAPVAALAVAAALCIGCSSSSSGSPAAPTGAGAGSLPASTGSLPSSGGASIGIGSLPATSGGSGDTGSGGTDFCSAFKEDDLSALASDPTSAIAIWDKLAAEAPSEIKGDVQVIANYLHDAVKGKIDPSAVQKISDAAKNIGTYFGAHCSGS